MSQDISLVLVRYQKITEKELDLKLGFALRKLGDLPEKRCLGNFDFHHRPMTKKMPWFHFFPFE